MVVLLFTHSVSMIVTMSAIVTIIFFLQLNQLFLLVDSKQIIKYRFSKRKQIMKLYLTHYHQILSRIFQSNKVYGMALVVYLLINCPINAYLLMTTLIGHIPRIQLLAITPFFLQQTICIFIFHFIATIYTKKLHRPVKNIIHIYIHCLNPNEILMFRLRLSHYIETFHTKKRYGVTYGNYGLVTLAGITKVCNFGHQFLFLN